LMSGIYDLRFSFQFRDFVIFGGVIRGLGLTVWNYRVMI